VFDRPACILHLAFWAPFLDPFSSAQGAILVTLKATTDWNFDLSRFWGLRSALGKNGDREASQQVRKAERFPFFGIPHCPFLLSDVNVEVICGGIDTDPWSRIVTRGPIAFFPDVT
jgi:hypothetical protein